jgi:hypothetical protein
MLRRIDTSTAENTLHLQSKLGNTQTFQLLSARDKGGADTQGGNTSRRLQRGQNRPQRACVKWWNSTPKRDYGLHSTEVSDFGPNRHYCKGHVRSAGAVVGDLSVLHSCSTAGDCDRGDLKWGKKSISFWRARHKKSEKKEKKNTAQSGQPPKREKVAILQREKRKRGVQSV